MQISNKSVGRVSISSIGHDIATYEVDKRLAFSGDTQWHDIAVSDISSAVRCQPPWNQVFLFPDAFPLVFGNDVIPNAFQFLGEQERVVVPPGTTNGHRWLADRALLSFSGNVMSPRDYLLQLTHKRCWGRLLYRTLESRYRRTPTVAELEHEVLTYRFGKRRRLRADLPTACRGFASVDWRDEFLLSAVYRGIIDGHGVLIVTSDETVLEQFITLACRLERDYRAAMLAEMAFAQLESPTFDERQELRNLGFLSSMYIATFDTVEVERRMPVNPWPLQFHCWLVKPNADAISVCPIVFRAERPMHLLFSNRNENSGRNCSLPEGINAHFSWEARDGGIIGRMLFAKGSQLQIGGQDFPVRWEYECPAHISTYEIVDVQNLCDPIALPWHC